VLGPISEPVLLPGGASKEAWAVDAGGERLLVRRAAGGVMCLGTRLGAGVGEAQRAVGYLVCIGHASLDEPRRPQRDQAGHCQVLAAQRLGERDRALEGLLQLWGGIAVPGIEWRRHGLEDRQFLAVTVAASGQVTDDRQSSLV